jgi:methyl-accepting chemotaxis protein
MTNVSDHITKNLKDLTEESSLLKNEIKQIEGILAIIKNTAVRSRILGLNASIEAARTEGHGKGFDVVANEIKKMADNSKETVEGVEPQLKEMIANLEKIITTIQHIYSNSQEQSAMMDEFHASFEQIVKTASQLSEQANIK